MKEPRISLVIPVFNEEELIADAINLSEDKLRSITKDYEIIIIDDGSTDETGGLIDNYAKSNSRVRGSHNKKNEGSGRSLFIGLKKARYEFIVTNFADLPFDLLDLKQIMAVFNDMSIDFVVVSRKNRNANSFYRKITSLANYWLIRIIFGVKVGDFQFVQVYRKRVIDSLDINSRGTFVPPEIIIKALASGFKMAEYKTSFFPRKAGISKCGSPRVILQSLYEMLFFWLNWHILGKKAKARDFKR
jgi:dolichol-phosphate mannosyltransferase